MRTVINNNTGTFAVILVLIFVFFAMLPLRPQQKLLYPVVRKMAQAKLDYETRGMAEYQTQNFIIKYTNADKDIVETVAKAAEQARTPVTGALGFSPQEKTTIIIYPGREQMGSSIKQLGSQSAMGVYWGGVIEVLSPHAWMNDGISSEKYIHTGPVLHEYTHLVFDYMTNGNYPRWFTEGLAQYMEYRVNNYEWLTPKNRLDQSLYSMQTLDDNFDSLDNQALAYRESLAAVRYIADVHGEAKLKEVISSLQSGDNMGSAINKALGMSYTQYEQAWKEWAVNNMKNDTSN